MGVFAAFSGGKIFSGFPGFSAPADRGTRTASACSPLTGGSFSAPESRGARTALACSPLTGGSFSCTGKPGRANCRRRVRPFRAESFSLNLSRGIRRLRTAGASRHPPQGAKRTDNLRFSFLFELLPFPCFLIRRRFPICDRFEKGNGSRVTAAFVSQHIRSSQIDYCYTYGQLYAGTAYANIIYCTIYRVGCDDPGAPYVNSYADA